MTNSHKAATGDAEGISFPPDAEKKGKKRSLEQKASFHSFRSCARERLAHLVVSDRVLCTCMLERYGDRGELFLGIARIILSLLGLAVMVRLSCTLQKTKVFFLSNKQHMMMHWVEAESREQKCLSLTYLSRRFMGNMRFALRCFLLAWKKKW